MTKEKYLDMCYAMHKEPDPNLTPVDFPDFPQYVQEVFTITNMLADMWDGASGTYLGKKMELIPYLFKLYDIQDPKFALFILNLIVGETRKSYNEKARRKRAVDNKRKK